MEILIASYRCTCALGVNKLSSPLRSCLQLPPNVGGHGNSFCSTAGSGYVAGVDNIFLILVSNNQLWCVFLCVPVIRNSLCFKFCSDI